MKEARWIAEYICSICGEHSKARLKECPFCHRHMINRERTTPLCKYRNADRCSYYCDGYDVACEDYCPIDKIDER